MDRTRAPRNRTLTINESEIPILKSHITTELDSLKHDYSNKTVCSDTLLALKSLPDGIADLIFVDPPYNIPKSFKELKFSNTSQAAYLEYLDEWFPELIKKAKPTATVYICGDWKSTYALHEIMDRHTIIRNRIIWQREKGRGAKTNWKNSCEDIWFGTISKDYYFDVDSVKQKRRVIAPYKVNGKPKDWEETKEGNYRLTHPSNFWDDITIPYWSMPENTDHPTQKPEKLLAKLILASCPKGGLVLDPFLGSGTTSVASKKLGRRFIGIECNEEYCLWSAKRLLQAESDCEIQGYSDGVFWERNTLNQQMANKKEKAEKSRSRGTENPNEQQESLFQ